MQNKKQTNKKSSSSKGAVQNLAQSHTPPVSESTPATQSPKSKCDLMFPIGFEDFGEIRADSFYYVDKTGLIEQLLTKKAKVTLFTRPRRFGKSLNVSMLKHFFEMDSDPALFDGLSITKRKDLCEQYMGKYPVVSLTLKEVGGLDFESAYAGLCAAIQREAMRHYYLKSSDTLSVEEKETFVRLLTNEPTTKDIKSSIKTLSTLLEKHHGQKTIILIDEYDVPLDKAYINGYYKKMIDLMRAFLGSALKTNSSLQFAVLTGCMRVSKESIFTGLNNFDVRGISDDRYTECFGFTETEVREMFEYYDRENRLQDAKEWYDGYHIGDQEIYCPWDVTKFCADIKENENAEPKLYWINTSGNDIVRRLIEKSDATSVKEDLRALINGNPIEKKLNLNITHAEIDENINNLWSLLYTTGYLTDVCSPQAGVHTLRIPNREIKQIYVEQVEGWFEEGLSREAQEKNSKIQSLYIAFEEGDAPTLEKLIDERLIASVSSIDAHENFYHAFLLALFNANPEWAARSNVEAGYGRGDIKVNNANYTLRAIVELKNIPAKTGSFDMLDDACREAMDQIDKKEYTACFREYGPAPVLKYGIAFFGKRCRVVCERDES